MNKKVALAGLGLALFALLGLPFFLTPKVDQVVADKELIVITPHWEGIKYEFDRGFREYWKEKTGETVKVQWLDVGGGTDALKFVLGQFRNNSESIGVDMFWGGGVDPFELMKEKGHLEPFKVSEKQIQRIPRRLFGYNLYAPNFEWYGTVISGFGIIYNKKVSELLGFPMPTTWEDLARPEVFSYIGTGDPANSSTSHVMYEFILQGYGFEKGMDVITRMAANARRFDKHSSNVSREVALGEVAYGISIDFYAGAAIAEAGADKLGFVYPNRLTVVNPDPIAILKGAPHPKLAREFLKYVLSDQAQRLWFLPKGSPGGPAKYNLMRVPILKDLIEKEAQNSSMTYNPFLIEGTLDYKQDFGSKRWTILNDFLRAALIDTHQDLVDAWKAIRKLPEKQREPWIERMTHPLVTEKEMFELAEGSWKNAEYRNNTRTEWTKAYRKRYQKIEDELNRGGHK